MRSIFNTNRTVKPTGQVASSEFALISIGGRTELGQSISGSYTRAIQTVHELGSPDVAWIAGHEQGSLSFQRLVGSKGFFHGWDSDACGLIRPVAINLGGGPCVASASGGLRFGGAMVESISFDMQAGTLEIREGIQMRVATMGRA
jgi:hypothetical protein